MKLIFDALILTLCAVWLIDDAISPADTFDSISVSVCVIRELRVLSASFARETSDVIEFSATVILDIAVSAVLFAVSAVLFAVSAVFFAVFAVVCAASAWAFATLIS